MPWPGLFFTLSWLNHASPADKIRPVPAPDDYRQEVNMSTTAFFHALHHRRDDEPFVYYTRSLLKGDFFPLTGDVDTAPFNLKENGKDFAFSSAEFTQLWVGAPGFVTQAHYDIYNNFYSQVSGRVLSLGGGV